jgi:hypothetical protein
VRRLYGEWLHALQQRALVAQQAVRAKPHLPGELLDSATMHTEPMNLATCRAALDRPRTGAEVGRENRLSRAHSIATEGAFNAPKIAACDAGTVPSASGVRQTQAL